MLCDDLMENANVVLGSWGVGIKLAQRMVVDYEYVAMAVHTDS